MIGSRL